MMMMGKRPIEAFTEPFRLRQRSYVNFGGGFSVRNAERWTSASECIFAVVHVLSNKTESCNRRHEKNQVVELG